MFKRRDPRASWDRFREFLWPRKGWRRGIRYIGHRVRRISDSAHNIALGFACGAFVSFSPLFGLHFLVAALLAWALRASVVASLFGTFVGNPITFPAIAVASMSVGQRLLGQDTGQEPAFEVIADAFGRAASTTLRWAASRLDGGAGGVVTNAELQARLSAVFDNVVLPYLVGGVAPGILCGVACYAFIRPVVAAYQKRRGERIARRLRTEKARRRKARKAAAAPEAPRAETDPRQAGERDDRT